MSRFFQSSAIQHPGRQLGRCATLCALVLLLVLLLLLVGQPLAAAGDVVVKPATPEGWVIVEEAPSGTGRFAAGPAVPPAGDGSILLRTNATGSVNIHTAAFAGTRLADISALSYHTYTSSGPAGRTLALVLDIDDDPDDLDDSVKAEAIFQPGLAATVDNNQWQGPWGAATLRGWILDPAGATTCVPATPCTMAELQNAFPTGAIAPTDGQLALRATAASGTGMEAFGDQLSITASSVVTTFDFELEQCTTTCYVDAINGDDTFSGKSPSEAKRTITAAVQQVTAGGTVIVGSGLYSEAGIILDKPLSITGVSRLNTLVDGSGSTIFLVQSGGVSLEGMTLQNGERAVYLLQASGPLDAVNLASLRLRNQSAAGVEVGSSTSVTDLEISDSLLLANNVGVKLASTAVVDGLKFVRSTVEDHATGLEQVNDGSSGSLRNLLIDSVAFVGNSTAAVSVQELAGATIQSSTFDANGMGIEIDKDFTTSGVAVGDITVRGNTFTDQTGTLLSISVRNSGLAPSLTVSNNTFDQDVSKLVATTPLVLIQLAEGAAHGAVLVVENEFTLSGNRGTGVEAVYGLQLAGAPAAVTVRSNRFAGGSVGSTVENPGSSAVYVQSDSDTYGAPDGATAIELLENTIGGFDTGVAIYDPVADQAGGLASGVVIRAENNNIDGNLVFGALNGTGAPLQAQRNWWGAPSGPAGAGSGAGDAVTDNVIFCPWLDAPAPAGSPVSPSGGFATTSTDNFQTPYCSIEEALFASQGAGQTVRVGPGTWLPETFDRDYTDSPGVTITAAGERTATMLTGIDLTGASFDGMTFDNLTWVSSNAQGAPVFPLTIDGAGSYVGLAVTNSRFDGQSLANRGAIRLQAQVDQTTIAGNEFQNYGAEQTNVPALIDIGTPNGATGKGLAIRNNDFAALPHAQAIALYRVGDAAVTANAIEGAGIAVSAEAATSSDSLGVTTIISNQLALAGSAVGIDLSSLKAPVVVENNRIDTAQSCIAAAGVETLSVIANKVANCSSQGLRFAATGVAPQSATIQSNNFITAAVGIENQSQLTLDVCDNFFSNVPETIKSNPGSFVPCPVVIEKFEDRNRNGTREPEEPGLVNWEFTVFQSGQPYEIERTSADGTITFPAIEPGAYEVCETLQPGWINTTALCQPLTAGPGQVNRLRFGNAATARIVIEKLAMPAVGTAFGFMTTIPSAEEGFTLYGLPENGEPITPTLPISASRIITFENIVTGIYTATEIVPEGWTLSDLTCADPTGDTSVDVARASARINLAGGETVACRFTNAATGGIAVLKETRPGGLVGPFVFEGALSGGLNHGGRLVRSGLAPGEYQVRETDMPVGFKLSDIRCDDAGSRGDVATGTATFTVVPGKLVTCTFINTLVGIDATPAVQVSEEGETAVYNITLAVTPRAAISLTIVPDDQVTTVPQLLVITPENWAEPHLVTVRAVDDDAVESPPGTLHAGRIRHEVVSADPYYDGIEIRDVVVGIVDNDFPGVIVTPTQLALNGEPDALSYTLQLASRPADAVTIDIASGSELVTTPTAVTFTPDNWSQAQRVTVEAASSADFSAAEIQHTARSSDPVYDGVTVPRVIVTKHDLSPHVHLPLTRNQAR